MRKPAGVRSRRSNLRVASISARSPRAATSSTMARVALSISADTSRFIARKPANRWAKSALFLSSRTGMLAFRRRASLEGPLLNGAATNRRQPFRLRIKLMMAERVFRHSGMVRRTRPQMCAAHRGISRFRVHRCAMPRNDAIISMRVGLRHPIRRARRPRRDRWSRDRRRRGRSARIPGIRRPAAAPRPG